MAVPQLSLFGIVVDDMPKALAFYRRLGLDIAPEADSQPHVETTLPGGVRLAWDTVETVRGYDPEWQAPTGSHRFAVAFEFPDVQSVDAKYAELVDAGYAAHRAPWDAVWGQRYAIVLDPDGTAVDLFAPLAG
ncbi:VOC family protein [Streptomyces pacificus]|uniref:Glyoxalase n=1 Tax=Streptomyces pacificus TaxID=2705029 RepID=A0A6A0AZ73_9ACTN|nr:VOC family protein [Streptomyces pacificus]GFH38249.1 glyoxalase [Streptomyces pacificus]